MTVSDCCRAACYGLLELQGECTPPMFSYPIEKLLGYTECCRAAVGGPTLLEPGAPPLLLCQTWMWRPDTVQPPVSQVDDDGESYWVFESRDVRVLLGRLCIHGRHLTICTHVLAFSA